MFAPWTQPLENEVLFSGQLCPLLSHCYLTHTYPFWISALVLESLSTVVKNLLGSAGDARDVGLIPGLGRFWNRKWQPTPVFLPGKYYGQRSLMGYSPWGCKESVTQSCPTLRPHGLQPARLLCPWDFSGRNTGVGCVSCSRGSSRSRNWTMSPALQALLYHWTTGEAQLADKHMKKTLNITKH